jgi:hypothetical protein
MTVCMDAASNMAVERTAARIHSLAAAHRSVGQTRRVRHGYDDW